MSNILLSYPDNTLAASLSGGSWLTALPLANLQNKVLSQKARSSNALAASTIINIDLGATARAIRCVAALAHNISVAGTIRARGYSDSGYTTLVTGADSGAVTAWPSGFTAADVADNPANWIFCFSSAKTARYWKIEITDTANGSGYIELGRLWLGEAFEPVTGASFGATLGYDSTDVIDTSLGGVDWGEARDPRRVATLTLGNLSTMEKAKALIMQKKLGKLGELLFVMNSTDTAIDMLLQAFPATNSSISPLTYPYFNSNELPLNLKEII